MASKDDDVGFLRVQLGRFARCTITSADGVRRELEISSCPVADWKVISLLDASKLRKYSFSKGKLLDLYLKERMSGGGIWKEEPEKIGGLYADRGWAEIFLPPHSFAPIWSAAEATDTFKRSIELELKARHPEALSVTKIIFFEAMPEDTTALEGKPPHA